MSALGAPRLAVPDNYYDDLAARRDIDPELLQALRRHRILYDRDAAGGELLHLYTTPFEDRFHVELLERRNGYRHYGSVNAPVRLAAMAQWREESARTPPNPLDAGHSPHPGLVPCTSIAKRAERRALGFRAMHQVHPTLRLPAQGRRRLGAV